MSKTVIKLVVSLVVAVNVYGSEVKLVAYLVVAVKVVDSVVKLVVYVTCGCQGLRPRGSTSGLLSCDCQCL